MVCLATSRALTSNVITKGLVFFNAGCRGGVEFGILSENFIPLRKMSEIFHTPTNNSKNISYPYTFNPIRNILNEKDIRKANQEFCIVNQSVQFLNLIKVFFRVEL